MEQHELESLKKGLKIVTKWLDHSSDLTTQRERKKLKFYLDNHTYFRH